MFSPLRVAIFADMDNRQPTILNKKQREYLRKHAQWLDPVVQIGKHALSNELFTKVDTELAIHELVKIKVLDSGTVDPDEGAAALAEHCGAALVTRIGKMIVLFRENPEGDPATIHSCGVDIPRSQLRRLKKTGQ